ncbi:MAG TPA: PTS sugar transporter subunit IIA [Polyangiaceae bacterium]|jgi:PTS system nitrogen regulatory IIA component|nr:PTS sugar transporter subunit IIA [Polyangiaceae bacterium]
MLPQVTTSSSMRLSDILTAERILIDLDGSLVKSKADVLRLLAEMLSPAVGSSREDVESLLAERERLQSTGIGDGVAIPHSSLDSAERQAAALLLVPTGVEFDAIDGARVRIVFGVVGPKRATGEHLRTLARISRLLRDEQTRIRLLESESPAAAYELIEGHEAAAR